MTDTIQPKEIHPDVLREYTPWTAVRRLMKYVRPYYGIALGAVLLSILSAVALVTRPYLIKVVIDDYITVGKTEGLLAFMAFFVGIYIIRIGIEYTLGYYTGMLGQRIMHDLRMDIFRHLMSMEMAFFDRNKVGRLMTRNTDDVNTLNELYTSGAVSILSNGGILAGIIIVMFMLDAGLALVTLAVIPLLVAVGWLFADRIRLIYRSIRRGTARVNAFLQESILGMRIIQMTRRRDWSYKKFEVLSNELKNDKVKNVFYYAIFFPIMEFIGAIGISVILVYSGWRSLGLTIEIGVVVAFMRLVDMFFWPVRELAENFNTLLSALAASERIFTLLDTKPSIVGTPALINKPSSEEIEFDRVYFGYNDDEMVLRDVSFKVAPGERVAFVGPSGAGKTSIINLLLRFYDVKEGRILLGGIDIREYPLEELRMRIAYVAQDPFLFNRTIQENISLGEESIDTATVLNLLKQMEGDAILGGMKEKLDMAVRERGSLLSMGQRQIVSFARALAADRPILILDEATSSVDTFTESLIQKAIPILLGKRTSIVIAHRLSTVRSMDRIHVIARGKIRETGNHSELMKQGGIYAGLVKMHMD